jgi:hypothetical protein
MNRFVMFCTGLLLMCSMTGCCLMHGYGGGYGAGYPGGGGCGSCGSCGGVQGGGYPSAFTPGPQTAFAPGYPATAYAPIDALPTYQ